ncbi:hypothetical protein H206_05349 [Candidatus Electrothrix aarhusensis]|uniref:Uncharacterized protein n=1 Tax=Candidatus Electrothrix aarhusensis TaxID=1859131 RepID=A0A3S3QLV2_9BACT|nr:hypothetical protein H206_05349 [Candidatus Electrothrix aarhusensis]
MSSPVAFGSLKCFVDSTRSSKPKGGAFRMKHSSSHQDA